MSWILLDVAAAALLVYFIYTRAKQGFASAVVGLISVVGSMVGAYLLAPYLARGIYRAFLQGPLLQRLTEGLSGAELGDSLVDQGLAALTALPELLVNALGLDALELNRALTQLPQSVEGMAQGLLDEVIEPALLSMLEILLSFVLFLVLLLILGWVARSMRVLQHIPIIGPINRLLGMGVGLLEGIVLLYLIGLVMQLVFALSSSRSLWIFTPESMHRSYILGHFLNF